MPLTRHVGRLGWGLVALGLAATAARPAVAEEPPAPSSSPSPASPASPAPPGANGPSVPASSATEPTKEQCMSANENAQTLRQASKLRAARAELLVCIRGTCPQAVRDDCAERLNDLERAIPTIVFAAKGPGDVDLTAVRVSMDGVVLTTTLDGSAIGVEPGQHTFELVTPGHPPVTRTLVVREGVKGRHESVSFGPPPSRAEPPRPPQVLTPGAATPDEKAAQTAGDDQRMMAYVLAGGGLLGIGLGSYFGLRASSTYTDAKARCPSGPTSCDAEGVRGGAQAHDQANVSTIAFIAGGALLAGGVIVYLTAPKAGAVGIQPTAGPTGAGLRLGGVW